MTRIGNIPVQIRVISSILFAETFFDAAFFEERHYFWSLRKLSFDNLGYVFRVMICENCISNVDFKIFISEIYCLSCYSCIKLSFPETKITVIETCYNKVKFMEI